MNAQFEVVSPWAEVDRVPLAGISPRVDGLEGKRIGLFTNDKVSASFIQPAIESRLKERFPDITLSHFFRKVNLEVAETPGKAAFERWAKATDAVILFVAD